jgi:hypothetical protein
MAPKPRHSIAAILALVVGLWAAPAHAGLITVDWDVAPHDDSSITYGDSPYYECHGSRYANRLCNWLWQDGLELGEAYWSFYDDRFFDLVGYDEGPVWYISPVCKADLAPCFDLFTPVTLRIDGASLGAAVNLYIASSRGGFRQMPEIDLLNGPAVINFSGDEWKALSFLEIGVYQPDECRDLGEFPEDPPHACVLDQEHALVIEDLTFSPVPEPGLLSLVAAGLLGAAVRRRSRS